MTLDENEFRAVLGRFATGVTVLTARDGNNRDHGMTVNAFCSVSLTPPLVLACIARVAEMYDVARESSHFGISILNENQEALSRRFAELPTARFDGVGYSRGESGVVLLDDALAHLECRRTAWHHAGDHAICVGEVDRASAGRSDPLLYYRSGYTRLER